MPASNAPARDSSRPREMILTYYGLHRSQDGGWTPIAALIRLMAEVDVDAPSVRSAVSRLKRRGLIEAHSVAGAAGYSLSPDAQGLLAEGDPRIFGRTRPALDDGWVLVLFSVPESERDKRHMLRSQLDRLGFGTVAPGVWIAPQHLADEAEHRIATLGLTEYVELFRHARKPVAELRGSVQRWWDLDQLAETYELFCASFEPMMRRWSRTKHLDEVAAFADYLRVVDSWRKIVYRDPGLPAELLPGKWVGQRAERVFFTLHAALADAAEKHARSVVDSS